MKIKSSFQHQQEIPIRYTCMGQNINPPLTFDDIPKEAVSLVLLLEDIDATPRPWRHWHVFNIPPTTTHVEEGQTPDGGTEGLCNNHTFGYEGPCPKYFKGTHRYWFRLYALDIRLDLPAASEPEEASKKMQGHVLASAELLGLCNASLYAKELEFVDKHS